MRWASSTRNFSLTRIPGFGSTGLFHQHRPNNWGGTSCISTISQKLTAAFVTAMITFSFFHAFSSLYSKKLIQNPFLQFEMKAIVMPESDNIHISRNYFKLNYPW
jgi:hypothetical protein